ncbi:COMM domain-containing protein 4 [Aethina tumida]|uniref:COMM domain-containing protein 4 n=1 Tax=Aethina tumida TaxID=116153 RepID=UPI00096B264B|nr:COMM domain-containing protein 4 [Aethina tumida]
MKFRFCGDADCPDWVLEEINTLSRLSSVKVKLLCQAVITGILKPPFNVEKAEKLFADSKLDSDIDLKACIACLTYIIVSAARFNCDGSALHSELQQLGLPREHSTSIKRVTDDQITNLAAKFRGCSLKVNPLNKISINVDSTIKCALMDLTINNENQKITLTPHTVNVLLEELKIVRNKMNELHGNSM